MPKKKGAQEAKSKVKSRRSKKKNKGQDPDVTAEVLANKNEPFYKEDGILEDETPSGALNDDEGDGADGNEVRKSKRSSAKKKAASQAQILQNTTDKEFIKECLEAHNRIREKHGASPLALNVELARLSQQWANQLAKNGKLQRYTGYAENVYWSPDQPSGSSPVEAWYSEIEKYDFSKLEEQKGTANFTQMIWKSTEMVGIAMQSGMNGYYVVVNYFPPGNIAERFSENVQDDETRHQETEIEIIKLDVDTPPEESTTLA